MDQPIKGYTSRTEETNCVVLHGIDLPAILADGIFTNRKGGNVRILKRKLRFNPDYLL
jgi:hypothetical protein